MREIEAGAFEKALPQHDDVAQSAGEMSEPVSGASHNPGVDKAPVINAACGPFVTACEPPRQESGMPLYTETNDTDITKCNCIVKDRSEKPATKLIDVIRLFKTERMLGFILDWLCRIDYSLTVEPRRWRCPWKLVYWALHPT
jgi:hypothetical protein